MGQGRHTLRSVSDPVYPRERMGGEEKGTRARSKLAYTPCLKNIPDILAVTQESIVKFS